MNEQSKWELATIRDRVDTDTNNFDQTELISKWPTTFGIYTVTVGNENCETEKSDIDLKDNGIDYVFFQEDNYPEKLKHCIDGPILLFQTGHINLEQQHIISIVGTRKITTNGIAFSEKLIEALRPYNPIIVSGFAYGTDITAHKLAIKYNLQTIGCLAHGLNQIYPKVHKKYMADVEKNGGFFSDFWSTDAFDRKNFLKRNL